MKSKKILAVAAIIAAAYGTEFRTESHDMSAAFKCAIKDMKGEFE
jgi:hypothetical protein